MKLPKRSGTLVSKFIQPLAQGYLNLFTKKFSQFELNKAGLKFTRQEAIPLVWGTIRLDAGFRVDFIVENKVIVELKSVEEIHPVHQKQVITYLKITKLKLGLLVNFNSSLLKDGFQRIANKL